MIRGAVRRHGAVFLAAFLLLTADRVDGQTPFRPPNIVLIVADDLGYGDTSPYAQKLIATPSLQRMADEGLRFTQHYSGAPVCAPARSVLMTGLHAGHTRVRGNFGADGERVPLAAEDTTVAEILRGAGYTTAIVGKWGLGEPGTTGVPNTQGFDFFYGYLNQRHAHSHYPEYLWRNTTREEIPGNAAGAEGAYSHDLFTGEALNFIGENAERPFFLYLAYTLPHAEVRAPAEAIEPYVDRFPPTEAHFAGMVGRLDRDVGRIMDRLEELGIAGNTLVLFTSDNGPHAEGGHDPHYFASSGGLRGSKRDLYEGGIRVPMIAWWPGVVQAGAVSHHPSSFTDFLATAAEIAGVAGTPATDGNSYAPTLRGAPQAEAPPIYWEFYEGTPAQAVRFGRWKAIRSPMHGGNVQLFDLEADPYEVKDLGAERPDVVARANELMNAAHRPSPHWPVSSN